MRKFSRIFNKNNWRSLWRTFWLLLVFSIFVAAVPGMHPDTESEQFQALGIARDHLFNFVEWEYDALTDKVATAALAPHTYMSEQQRVQYVRDYLSLIYDIHQLETQVQDIYIDPTVDNPEAATEEIRAERDRLRNIQQQQQGMAEAIIQAQVSQQLVQEGFGTAGQLLPSTAIRFSELPTIMIVSPRDHIERIGAYPLDNGLTVDQKDAIETNVSDELDVAALIVPLGGLAVYPAMMVETGWAPSVFDITAHEWAHHYLAFYPMGFNYGTTPDLYTMNETVASIIGKEISYNLLSHYYPEYAEQISPPDYNPQSTTIPAPSADPMEAVGLEKHLWNLNPVLPYPFDFRAEMRITRVRVDELLAAGHIEQADEYMEQRRQYFVANGYSIRKLNQAYFAFYGAYADTPGATGSDPIGPALRELRYHSNSLYDFVETVRGATTFDEIETELEVARREAAIGR